MPRFKIDTQTAAPKRNYPKPRPCEFPGCGVMITGYRWCPEHAAVVKAKQQAANRKVKTSSRAAELRMDAAVVAAMSKGSDVANRSDILHAPPEKAAKLIDDILKGRVHLSP